MIQTKLLEIYLGEGFAVQNITHLVDEFIREASIQQGQLIAYYKHTTGSIFIGEHEPGIIADMENVFEFITPENGEYIHHERHVDYNGYAHVRAAIMPTSIAVPIIDGEMVLGTHQEILVLDNQPEEFARFVILFTFR